MFVTTCVSYKVAVLNTVLLKSEQWNYTGLVCPREFLLSIKCRVAGLYFRHLNYWTVPKFEYKPGQPAPTGRYKSRPITSMASCQKFSTTPHFWIMPFHISRIYDPTITPGGSNTITDYNAAAIDITGPTKGRPFCPDLVSRDGPVVVAAYRRDSPPPLRFPDGP